MKSLFRPRNLPSRTAKPNEASRSTKTAKLPSISFKFSSNMLSQEEPPPYQDPPPLIKLAVEPQLLTLRQALDSQIRLHEVLAIVQNDDTRASLTKEIERGKIEIEQAQDALKKAQATALEHYEVLMEMRRAVRMQLREPSEENKEGLRRACERIGRVFAVAKPKEKLKDEVKGEPRGESKDGSKAEKDESKGEPKGESNAKGEGEKEIGKDAKGAPPKPLTDKSKGLKST